MRISDWSSDVCSSDLASDLRETYIHLHAINGLLATISKPKERMPIEEERLRIARKYYEPGNAGLSFNMGESTPTPRKLGMLDRAEALARESIASANSSSKQPTPLSKSEERRVGKKCGNS